jgi:hypothetical protein
MSGYHGLFVSLAILPPVLAVVLWERLDPGWRRALTCGLLIGAGGAIQTVPLLILLALVPWASSRREAALLIGAAVGLVALALLPFQLADHSSLHHISRYGGVPGVGGLSLAIQPHLARTWLVGGVHPSEATLWLVHHQKLVNVAVVGAVALFLWRTRPEPARGAAYLCVALWAFGTGFFFQYLVWGLPFLILAGGLRTALLLQAAVLVPLLLFYGGPWRSEAVVYVFVGAMLTVWAAWLCWLGMRGREFWRARPARV